MAAARFSLPVRGSGSGTIAYTELLAAMHAGRRYDAFQRRTAAPPLPPLLVCTHGAPLADNPAFLEDVELLVRGAAAVHGLT